MAGHSSDGQPCSVMSGHTPVAMSWSTARSSSTATPCRSMIERLRSISPWVWLGSGDRLRVQLTYSARRSSNRHAAASASSCSVTGPPSVGDIAQESLSDGRPRYMSLQR
jgi:hypothetical protein